jgi:RNA polymerase sigma factor (sigma-70 family)
MDDSDEDLMDAYCAGDSRAFTRLFDRYRPRLVRFAQRFVGPHLADDVTQQTFLRVHTQRHRFSAGTNLAAWMFTIARNVAIDVTRAPAQRRQALHVPIEHVDPAASDPRLPNLAMIARIRDAIVALPEPQRDVISLHYLAELPFPEVAALLHIKPDAARARAARAYETLRTLLGSALEVRHDG